MRCKMRFLSTLFIIIIIIIIKGVGGWGNGLNCRGALPRPFKLCPKYII